MTRRRTLLASATDVPYVAKTLVPRVSSVPGRQQGFALAELLVALVLSLLLLFAAVQVFVANKLTFKTQQGLGQVVESGRYAMDQLVQAVRAAGYVGCSGSEISAPRVLASGTVDMTPVSGCDGSYSCSVLPSSVSAYAGTDLLVVRGAGHAGVGFTGAPVTVGAAVPVAFGYQDFKSGDLALISDCEGANIFRVTGVAYSGSVLQLSHGTNLSKVFQSDAVVAKFYAYAFYVGDTGRVSATGKAIQAMYRRDLDTGATDELAEGVSNLQLIYGIDQDGDRQADRYVSANAVPNWSQVVSVRVSLLADSVENSLSTRVSYSFAGATITPSTSDDLRIYKELTGFASLRNQTP